MTRRGMAAHDNAVSPAVGAFEPRGLARDELGELPGKVLEIGRRREGDLGVNRERQQSRALLMRAGLHAADVADDGSGGADQVFRREAILRGVWDNLGRVVAEFTHIDELWDYDRLQGSGRIMRSDDSEKIAFRLRDDGKPALVFAAHVGNWELPAIAARMYGLDSTVLYRRPNLKAVADEVAQARAGCMGKLLPTTMDAPVKLADALDRGSHVAMLVDQWYGPGVPVTFFTCSGEIPLLTTVLLLPAILVTAVVLLKIRSTSRFDTR